MKKFLPVLLVVIVVAIVAIGFIVADRNAINDKHIAATKTIDELNKQVKDAATEAEKSLSENLAKIEALENDLSTAQAELATTQETALASNAAIEALNKAIADAKTEAEALQAANEALQTEIEEKVKAIADSEAALTAAKDEGASLLAKAISDAEKALKDAQEAAASELAAFNASSEAALKEAANNLKKAEDNAKKALEDSKLLADAKELAEKTLADLNAEIDEAKVIWEKIKKNTLTNIEKDIEAFEKKYPNSSLQFILPPKAQ